MKIVSVSRLQAFINNNREKLKDIKVGKVDVAEFNNMEGYTYLVSIKIVTNEGYKNKLIKLIINSGEIEYYLYPEEHEDEETIDAEVKKQPYKVEEEIQQIINNLFNY